MTHMKGLMHERYTSLIVAGRLLQYLLLPMEATDTAKDCKHISQKRKYGNTGMLEGQSVPKQPAFP